MNAAQKKSVLIFIFSVIISVFSIFFQVDLSPRQSDVWEGSWWGPLTSFFNAGNHLQNFLLYIPLSLLILGLLKQKHPWYLVLLTLWSFIGTLFAMIIIDQPIYGISVIVSTFFAGALPGLFVTSMGRKEILWGYGFFFAYTYLPQEGIENIVWTISSTFGLFIGWLNTFKFSRKVMIWGLFPTLPISLLVVFGFPWGNQWQVQKLISDLNHNKYSQIQTELPQLLHKNKNNPKLIPLARAQALGKLPQLPHFGEEFLLHFPNQFDAMYALSEVWLGKPNQRVAKHDLILKLWNNKNTDNPFVQNIQAMIYCGSSDTTLQNPKKGLELSTDANQNTQWSKPEFLDTHASCLQANKLNAQAIKWSKIAVELTKNNADTSAEYKEALSQIQANAQAIAQNRKVFY